MFVLCRLSDSCLQDVLHSVPCVDEGASLVGREEREYNGLTRAVARPRAPGGVGRINRSPSLAPPFSRKKGTKGNIMKR